MSCKVKFNLDASSFSTFSISIDCFISCINPLLLNSLQLVSPLCCNALPAFDSNTLSLPLILCKFEMSGVMIIELKID